MAKKICPTCEGEVKFDIIDGKCKACRLGVVPDWRCPEVATRGPFDEEWCYPCHLPKGHEGWHKHETRSGSLIVTWEA